MSQQHTTQTSGQGLLERVFKLREHGTTARTEVIAGFTTFLTMVYIVFVNPQILGVAGMDTSAVFVTSSLSRVKWDDLTEAVPAFITAVMMPFSFSITEGIALGFISYCVMKIGTGRFRDLSPCVIIVALLFVLKIVFIDAK
ncbi:hypothetical protein DD604_14450 [Enterobacter cloacae]|uniref:hypothetical protein n=1 Tax=Enterobacter cloacae TaxID=550 RepID=UPI00101203F9|nr:hypothetical protein [Enterobacter cloacae]RXX48990.1 hypothetical protein DD604_14450 [Enterobacter cloacae]